MFDPGLKKGDAINNNRLCEIFRCSTQGGMRRSHETNSLVIVSDHTVGLYEDRWEGDVFHYTGMGRIGDQNLSFAQNKTLAESPTNTVTVFLFEVFDSGRYIFQGPVKLSGKPYQEDQPDDNGKMRKAWVFPLVLSAGGNPIAPEADVVEAQQKRREKAAQKLSTAELLARVGNKKPRKGKRNVTAPQYYRDPHISELVKRIARGHCQLCGSNAPFKTKDSRPFLETHHIQWLAKNGADSLDNTVALCPNCHRKMHILDKSADRKALHHIAKEHVEAAIKLIEQAP